MHFFNSGLFWFLEGVFVCLAVIGFKIWMEDRKIPMPYWKWILLGIWVLFFAASVGLPPTRRSRSPDSSPPVWRRRTTGESSTGT